MEYRHQVIVVHSSQLVLTSFGTGTGAGTPNAEALTLAADSAEDQGKGAAQQDLHQQP